MGGDEVVRLLASPPGSSPFADLDRTDVLGLEPGSEGAEPDALSWLCATRDLDDLDRAILLVALAPDVDLRYERLYAYLQDDVTRRRPTVDLALNLLTAGPAEKLDARARFGSEAPLVRHGVVTLVADPGQLPPLLAHVVRPDERVVSFLLGSPALDPRLAAWCRVHHPTTRTLEGLPVEPETRDALARAIDRARAGRPLRLHLHGPAGHPARTSPRRWPRPSGRPCWPPTSPPAWPRASIPRPRRAWWPRRPSSEGRPCSWTGSTPGGRPNRGRARSPS